jgi:tetratricopeptide (TPR) repeat protein
MYVPCLGLLIMAVWGGAELALGRRRGAAWWGWRWGWTGFGGLLLAGCVLAARTQLGAWRNTVTLFEHAAAVTVNNYVAQSVLGSEAERQGKLDEAEARFRGSLRMAPDGLGARRNLGRLLAAKGNLEEAAAHFEECIRMMPRAPGEYNNLGRVRLQQGRLDEAVTLFSQAVQLKPNSEEAHVNLGLTYGLQGKLEQVVAEFKIAVQLAPGDAMAQNKLATALIKLGRADEAIRHCQTEAQARPKDPVPHFVLGGVYVTQDRPEAAVVQFKEALRLAPDNPAGLNDLAWLYASHPDARIRNGVEAVRLAERACELTSHKLAGFLDTLGAAYAEAGRFAEAIKTGEEAQAVALAANDRKLAEAAAQKLELYKTGKPYREERAR